jgi:DNA-binding NarL/FixJ family response regulator
VILVDDHPIVRRGLRDILVDAFPGAIIHEVGSGSEAIASLQSAHQWSVMVLDLSLPDGSGLDVLKRVRERRPRLPVLILSMHAADQFARRAIAAGASGYLTKDAADSELVTAVSRLSQRCSNASRLVCTLIARTVLTSGSQTASTRSCG